MNPNAYKAIVFLFKILYELLKHRLPHNVFFFLNSKPYVLLYNCDCLWYGINIICIFFFQ